MSIPSYSPRLSQVLGGGAAEEGAWSESPTVGGHLQVSLVEGDIAGNTAVHACNSSSVCTESVSPPSREIYVPQKRYVKLECTAVMSVRIYTHMYTHTHTHCIGGIASESVYSAGLPQ